MVPLVPFKAVWGPHPILFIVFVNPFLRADEESAKAFADDRPNIIFFLTDDQRNDFLGCTGHPIIKTPNIDQLASEGTLFENAFVSTSICAASRAGCTKRSNSITKRPSKPARGSVFPADLIQSPSIWAC